MALTKCKECGKEVSSSAAKCPHCGVSSPGVTAKAMLVGAMALVAFVGGCVAWVASSGGDGTLAVKASEYGDRWPLVAQEARLGCAPTSARYVEVEGIRYALNGKALTAGMPRPDAIQKDGEGFKMADFVERSGGLCR